MMTSTNPVAIELLSPARNLTCGIAAIDHGADAVYIGAERFGARSAAGNSIGEIARLCSYAHQYGARIYVTVNTILYDNELAETEHLVWELYQAGVDALIVQDMALLRMNLPPIPLHASTQMDNRSAQKVAWLASLGFRQAVLARELTIGEIAQIHRAVPGMALEVFCHGALCVSYSGQCYASQFCFGRSANRGECAQFCRLPFNLQDASGSTIVRNRHLLSLRDMNRSQWLEEMMDAGARSFKIEGRLKDVSYVKNVTAYYRQRLDAILSRRPEYVRSSYGSEHFTFRPDPDRSFSRGFTDYFLHGRKLEMSSPLTPKSRGLEAGKVKEVRSDCIIVSGTTAFHNGDGLCYIDHHDELRGFRVNRAEGNHLFIKMPEGSGEKESRLLPGTILYRSYDQEWERQMAGNTAERRITVSWQLRETPEGFALSVFREDGATCSLQAETEHQPAQSDQSRVITEVLSKTGNTIYQTAGVEVQFSEPWFIPRSQLAEWRRSLLSQLSEKPFPLHDQPLFLPQGGSPDATPNPTEVAHPLAEEALMSQQKDSSYIPPSSYRANVSNRLARSFYESLGYKGIPAAMEVSPQSFQEGGGVLMHCRFCLKYELGWCRKLRNGITPPPEPYYLVSPSGQRFLLRFDCAKCEMTVENTKP